MNAKMCDRCGEYYAVETESMQGAIENITEAVKQLFESNENYRARLWVGSIEEKVDLCKNCSKSLKEWLIEGRRNGKEAVD